MRHPWFDKNGTRIDMHTAERLLADLDYKRVGGTRVTSVVDACVDYWISTVWLGMNYNFGDGPPILFETMVFAAPNTPNDQDMWRWGTLDEAVAGHAEVVALIADTVPEVRIEHGVNHLDESA